MEKRTLCVEGMSCDHCKRAVENAVRGLDGVIAAEVNLTEKSLTIEYDEVKVSLEKIAEVIDEEGYSVGTI